MNLVGNNLDIPRKISTGAIASLNSLYNTLGCTESEITSVLNIPPDQLYTEIRISKAGGKQRVVYNPHRLLRRLQKKINEQIFSNSDVISWPCYLYGSIPNQNYEDGLEIYSRKDYVSCAARHCGARSLLKLDVENFFDNIHYDVVYAVFSDFLKCSSDVSDILSRLCCKGEHLVQGALTSSYLASLCLYDLEGAVAERLRRKGFVYTRLVDDVTVSSKKLNVDFTFARNTVVSMLEGKDLPVNESKTKVHRVSTVPLSVHGLRIGFSTPRLPADEVRRIRAAVRNIESLATESNYRTTHAYRHEFNRCMGRVNKLLRVEHSQHPSLASRLERIRPLPSFRDIARAKGMIDRLRSDHTSRAHTHWYKTRYHKVLERLIVLQRTYKHVSYEFRVELKGLKPI
ncbi:hypothetical protein LCGC14_1150700 [marine sediment metagenome]|uniref:Reverse transcriptase domain-containing protein n=1 Tax=marine sediment metagenome TaxID=412755 RepID=A0A0F9M0G7_9ZZZZ|nr:RNA-directed DNA polymerase [Halopseudomonas sabulinigri]